MNKKSKISLVILATLSTTLLLGCGGDKIIVGSETNANPISSQKPVLNVYTLIPQHYYKIFFLST